MTNDANVTRRSVMQLTGAALAVPVVNFQPSKLESGQMPFSPKFADMVRSMASVTGTGPVALGAPVSGFTGLADAVQPGEQFYYSLQSVDKPAEREVGRGTMQADGRVARQAIGGLPTSFTGGTKTIALVTPAEWFERLDQLAGAAMVTVATRNELAAKPTGRALLAEGDRAGIFAFDERDLSAKVAADPRQGMYVAAASDPSGRSGAWVRQSGGALDIRWFGAVLDNATDDSAAVLAAVALSKALAVNVSQNGLYKSGPRVYVPPVGTAYMGTTTLDITHTLILEGDANAHNGTSHGSALRWADGATGIRIQAHNTSAATTVDGELHFSGAGTIIRNLALIGGYSGAEGNFHGIHGKARFTAEHVMVANFPGDGIHINASSMSGNSTEGNANLFRVADGSSVGNRNGIFLAGADSNAGRISNFDFSYNRQWGVNETSFLGNTYDGCHTSGNGRYAALPALVSHGGHTYAVKDGQEAAASTNAPSGGTTDNAWWYFAYWGGPNAEIPAWTSGMAIRAGGSFRTANANGANVFIGCYAEGDQGPAQLVYPTVVIGGMLASGVKGSAAYLRNIAGGLFTEKMAAASASFDSLNVNSSLAFQNGSDLTFFSGYNGGDAVCMGTGLNFGGAPANGIQSLNTGGGSRPFQIYSENIKWMAPDGFIHATIDMDGLAISAAGDGGIRLASGNSIKIGSTNVLGSQQAAIADHPSDATVNAILAALRAHGLIAT